MNLWINDNYYKVKPEHILGEAKEKTNAFGKTYTDYEGDAQAALAVIRTNNPSYSVGSSQPKQRKKIVPLVKQEQHLDQAIQKAKKEEKEMEQGIKAEDLDLISFEEIDMIYNKHLSKEQKQVFVWYMRYLGRKMNGGWYKYQVVVDGKTGYPKVFKDWINQGLVCYDGEKYEPRFVFESGNIYEKELALEQNKAVIVEKYGEKVYTQQIQFLQSAVQRIKDRYLRLDAPDPSKRLRILVTDKIATSYPIASLKDGIPFKGRKSKRAKDFGQMDFKNEVDYWNQKVFPVLDLQTAFLWWLRSNTDTAAVRFGLTWEDLMRLVIDNRSRKKDEDIQAFRRDKKNAKAEAERLFSRFLGEEILDEDRKKIETDWNKKYNGIVPIDYNQVPIGFSMARYYRGMEMDIRPEKREAIAASMMQGSLCIAYGVGLGKTWCAIFCMAQFMENGWASRPLLAVPLQVYPQFVREIKGILPQIQVNELGNLGEKFLPKVRDEEGKTKQLPVSSISVITYHGYKQIGFSDDVATSLLMNINEILNQGQRDIKKKKTKRKEASEQSKAEGILGDALKGTKVDIDKLGIDFIAIDEAHAAKKIFTSVAAEATAEGKRGRVEYKINSGTPSSMGLKTFALAQYVQHINPTGNILLLSATPFTNSPLEVFSMLSIMAYKELKSVGLNSIKDFFDKFVLVKDQLVIDTSLQPVHKEVFTGFANLVGLQGFIRKYFLYKQKTQGLKRPNKYVLPYKPSSKEEAVSSIIPLSTEQLEIMNFVTGFAQGQVSLPEDKVYYEPYKKPVIRAAGKTIKDDDTGARVLLSVGLARALALSPYLFPYKVEGLDLPTLTYKTYIESSAKLQYTMNCIKSVKEAHEKKKEAVSGQIIYMNLGVQYFPLIKEYLVKEVGYKEHEVGIIQGTMPSHEDKAAVQDLFLGRRFNPATKEYEELPDKWRVKVLLGSNS
ncbi:MAG: DEAD/DEAH box helicase family protein, partial [Saprospiraceae bacterium]|nr:DEAD/DEAH box helicase family protein [Saprospiraceae bacterium]